MNDGGHMHGMEGYGGASSNGTMRHRHMMMHMTFFWGKSAEILFNGWPGYDRLGMYVLALALVFFLAVFIEWISNCNILRRRVDSSTRAAATTVGLLQTLLYSLRIGLAYVVMLAVMSFNGGVFLVAIAGHSIGFFLFGSSAFSKQAATAEDAGKLSDPPPINCCL